MIDPMVTLPHQRLVEWFKLANEQLQLERFESVFTVDGKPFADDVSLRHL